MRQKFSLYISLLILLSLSGCALTQRSSFDQSTTLSSTEVVETDVAQNNATDSIVQQKSNEENDTASEHIQEDEKVSSDKNYIQVQHYEKMLDLSLIPEETMSYEAYFSEIRQEQGGMRVYIAPHLLLAAKIESAAAN